MQVQEPVVQQPDIPPPTKPSSTTSKANEGDRYTFDEIGKAYRETSAAKDALKGYTDFQLGKAYYDVSPTIRKHVTTKMDYTKPITNYEQYKASLLDIWTPEKEKVQNEYIKYYRDKQKTPNIEEQRYMKETKEVTTDFLKDVINDLDLSAKLDESLQNKPLMIPGEVGRGKHVPTMMERVDDEENIGRAKKSSEILTKLEWNGKPYAPFVAKGLFKNSTDQLDDRLQRIGAGGKLTQFTQVGEEQYKLVVNSLAHENIELGERLKKTKQSGSYSVFNYYAGLIEKANTVNSDLEKQQKNIKTQEDVEKYNAKVSDLKRMAEDIKGFYSRNKERIDEMKDLFGDFEKLQKAQDGAMKDFKGYFKTDEEKRLDIIARELSLKGSRFDYPVLKKAFGLETSWTDYIPMELWQVGNSFSDFAASILKAPHMIQSQVDVSLGKKEYTYQDRIFEVYDHWYKNTFYTQAPETPTIANDFSKFNVHMLPVEASKTITDMVLLIGSAAYGGQALQTMGMVQKVAGSVSLTASGYTLTYWDYYDQAKRSGYTNIDAHKFAHVTAGITALMENISPNKGIQKYFLKSNVIDNLATDALVKQAAKSEVSQLSVPVYKRIASMMLENFEEITQELSQTVAEKFNGFVFNETYKEKYPEQDMDQKIQWGEMANIALMTALSTSLLNVKSLHADTHERSGYFFTGAYNYDEFDKHLKTLWDEKRIKDWEYWNVKNELDEYKSALDGIPAFLKNNPTAITANLVRNIVAADRLTKEYSKIKNVDETKKAEFDKKLDVLNDRILKYFELASKEYAEKVKKLMQEDKIKREEKKKEETPPVVENLKNLNLRKQELESLIAENEGDEERQKIYEDELSQVNANIEKEKRNIPKKSKAPEEITPGETWYATPLSGKSVFTESQKESYEDMDIIIETVLRKNDIPFEEHGSGLALWTIGQNNPTLHAKLMEEINTIHGETVRTGKNVLTGNKFMRGVTDRVFLKNGLNTDGSLNDTGKDMVEKLIERKPYLRQDQAENQVKKILSEERVAFLNTISEIETEGRFTVPGYKETMPASVNNTQEEIVKVQEGKVTINKTKLLEEYNEVKNRNLPFGGKFINADHYTQFRVVQERLRQENPKMSEEKINEETWKKIPVTLGKENLTQYLMPEKPEKKTIRGIKVMPETPSEDTPVIEQSETKPGDKPKWQQMREEGQELLRNGLEGKFTQRLISDPSKEAMSDIQMYHGLAKIAISYILEGYETMKSLAEAIEEAITKLIKKYPKIEHLIRDKEELIKSAINIYLEDNTGDRCDEEYDESSIEDVVSDAVEGESMTGKTNEQKVEEIFKRYRDLNNHLEQLGHEKVEETSIEYSRHLYDELPEDYTEKDLRSLIQFFPDNEKDFLNNVYDYYKKHVEGDYYGYFRSWMNQMKDFTWIDAHVEHLSPKTNEYNKIPTNTVNTLPETKEKLLANLIDASYIDPKDGFEYKGSDAINRLYKLFITRYNKLIASPKTEDKVEAHRLAIRFLNKITGLEWKGFFVPSVQPVYKNGERVGYSNYEEIIRRVSDGENLYSDQKGKNSAVESAFVHIFLATYKSGTNPFFGKDNSVEEIFKKLTVGGKFDSDLKKLLNVTNTEREIRYDFNGKKKVSLVQKSPLHSILEELFTEKYNYLTGKNPVFDYFIKTGQVPILNELNGIQKKADDGSYTVIPAEKMTPSDLAAITFVKFLRSTDTYEHWIGQCGDKKQVRFIEIPKKNYSGAEILQIKKRFDELNGENAFQDEINALKQVINTNPSFFANMRYQDREMKTTQFVCNFIMNSKYLQDIFFGEMELYQKDKVEEKGNNSFINLIKRTSSLVSTGHTPDTKVKGGIGKTHRHLVTNDRKITSKLDAILNGQIVVTQEWFDKYAVSSGEFLAKTDTFGQFDTSKSLIDENIDGKRRFLAKGNMISIDVMLKTWPGDPFWEKIAKLMKENNVDMLSTTETAKVNAGKPVYNYFSEEKEEGIKYNDNPGNIEESIHEIDNKHIYWQQDLRSLPIPKREKQPKQQTANTIGLPSGTEIGILSVNAAQKVIEAFQKKFNTYEDFKVFLLSKINKKSDPDLYEYVSQGGRLDDLVMEPRVSKIVASVLQKGALEKQVSRTHAVTICDSGNLNKPEVKEGQVLFGEVACNIPDVRYSVVLKATDLNAAMVEAESMTLKDGKPDIEKFWDLYDDNGDGIYTFRSWEVRKDYQGKYRLPGELTINTRVPADGMRQHSLLRATYRIASNASMIAVPIFSRTVSSEDLDGDARFIETFARLFNKKTKKSEIIFGEQTVKGLTNAMMRLVMSDMKDEKLFEMTHEEVKLDRFKKTFQSLMSNPVIKKRNEIKNPQSFIHNIRSFEQNTVGQKTIALDAKMNNAYSFAMFYKLPVRFKQDRGGYPSIEMEGETFTFSGITEDKFGVIKSTIGDILNMALDDIKNPTIEVLKLNDLLSKIAITMLMFQDYSQMKSRSAVSVHVNKTVNAFSHYFNHGMGQEFLLELRAFQKLHPPTLETDPFTGKKRSKMGHVWDVLYKSEDDKGNRKYTAGQIAELKSLYYLTEEFSQFSSFVDMMFEAPKTKGDFLAGMNLLNKVKAGILSQGMLIDTRMMFKGTEPQSYIAKAYKSMEFLMDNLYSKNINFSIPAKVLQKIFEVDTEVNTETINRFMSNMEKLVYAKVVSTGQPIIELFHDIRDYSLANQGNFLLENLRYDENNLKIEFVEEFNAMKISQANLKKFREAFDVLPEDMKHKLFSYLCSYYGDITSNYSGGFGNAISNKYRISWNKQVTEEYDRWRNNEIGSKELELVELGIRKLRGDFKGKEKFGERFGVYEPLLDILRYIQGLNDNQIKKLGDVPMYKSTINLLNKQRQEGKTLQETAMNVMELFSSQMEKVRKVEEEEIEKPTEVSIKGINISSYELGLGSRLTNFAKIPIIFRGKTYQSSEQAYQTNKTDNSNEAVKKLMIEIITAKLQQHPELVKEIDDNGGIDFLNESTHNLIKNGRTVKTDRWTGKDGLFMQSLREAYNIVKSETKPEPVIAVKDQAMSYKMPAKDNLTGEDRNIEEVKPEISRENIAEDFWKKNEKFLRQKNVTLQVIKMRVTQAIRMNPMITTEEINRGLNLTYKIC